MSWIKKHKEGSLGNFEGKDTYKKQDSTNEGSGLPKFNDNDVIIEDNEVIFHCFTGDNVEIGLKIEKHSESNYRVNWVDFNDKSDLTVGMIRKHPFTVKNEGKDKEFIKFLANKLSIEIDEGLMLGKFDDIGLYILNNNPFEYGSSDKEDDDIERVKMSELRQNPEYNSITVDDFLKKLADKYDNDVLSFIADKSKNLILNESNNVCKQILIYETVILGRQGFLVEIHAHADAGKSYIFLVSLMFIPRLYIFDVNDFTVASFMDEAINDSQCYDRVLINLGDLGNEKIREKLEPIFDIIKILITEGKYVSRKKVKNQDNTYETVETVLEAVLGALYSTVHEDSVDKTSQIESRTVSSAPVTNINEEKLRFMQNSQITGTIENEYYNKTLKELEEFHEFLKYKVVQYEEKKNDLEIFVPFIKTFDKVSSNRSTGTRKVKQLLSLMETYTFLNYERSFKINKTINGEEKEYLIPKVEDMQKFINIIYDGAGLQVHERNMILKLKNELEIKNQDKIDDIIIKSSEKFHWMEDYDISELQNEEVLIKDILNTYGLSKVNRKYNKKLSKDSNKDESKKHKSFVFFTVSEFKQIFKNHNAVKNVNNMSTLMNKLVNSGFINKLEAQTSRRHNIYYLDESVTNVHNEYTISKKDVIDAIDNLKTVLKKNPKDKNSEPLLDDNDLKDIIDNYEKFI